MKILAVDDDPMFLDLLRAVLASTGYRDVTTATSAERAAELIVAASPPFDCCFIDMWMPDIAGDYLCRWIRRLPAYRDSVILMITAAAQKTDVERAFVAGASDYMTKPVDLSELTDRARQIERRGRRQPAQQRKQLPQGPEGAAFSDAVKIEGVARAVALGALENYLLQLSRSRVHDMVAIAFRMPEAAKLHLRCAPDVFAALLGVAAEAILERLPVSHPLIAYAGYGAFVVVADAVEIEPEQRAEVEAAINAGLVGLGPAAGAGEEVQLRMSRPQPLGSRAGQQMLDAMYRAISDVEAATLAIRLPAAS